MELNDITVFVDESGTIGKGIIEEDDLVHPHFYLSKMKM